MVQLVLIVIGWKTGATLSSQSLSVAIAITYLLSTVIWKLLYTQQQFRDRLYTFAEHRNKQFCWRYVNWFNCQRSLWVQRRVLEQFCKFNVGLGITVCSAKHQHARCDEGQFQRDSFNLGKGTCWHSKEGDTFPGILASWEGIQEYSP